MRFGVGDGQAWLERKDGDSWQHCLRVAELCWGWGLGEPQRDLGRDLGERTEQPRLEGISKDHPVQPLLGKGTEMRLLGTLSNHILTL